MELKDLINPKTTSLLVIDIQNDYCSPEGMIAKFERLNMSPVQRMIPKLGKFVTKARNVEVPVIWTQMAEDREHVPPNIRAKINSFEKPLDLCIPGTWGYDFYVLKPATKDKVVPKNHYDAFTNPKLKQLLDYNKTETVITTGVYTSRCVDSTARRASAEGYNVVIPRDLVAMPRQLREKHKVSLDELDLLFGYVVKSNQIVSAWKGK